jgi:hypothetical protein
MQRSMSVDSDTEKQPPNRQGAPTLKPFSRLPALPYYGATLSTRSGSSRPGLQRDREVEEEDMARA